MKEGRMPDGSRVSLDDMYQRAQMGPSSCGGQEGYERFFSEAKAALAEANDCTPADVDDALTRRMMDARHGSFR